MTVQLTDEEKTVLAKIYGPHLRANYARRLAGLREQVVTTFPELDEAGIKRGTKLLLSREMSALARRPRKPRDTTST